MEGLRLRYAHRFPAKVFCVFFSLFFWWVFLKGGGRITFKMSKPFSFGCVDIYIIYIYTCILLTEIRGDVVMG